MLSRLGISSSRFLSRLAELPLVGILSPSVCEVPERELLGRYLSLQNLAWEASREIASLLKEGWTESQAALLLDSYLRDHQVASYFHRPFAWFGDRTRFSGIRRYGEYQPSDRVLTPGDVFILDVAPIKDGVMCDIGYTDSFGPNLEWERARAFLRSLRAKIPDLFQKGEAGAYVWREVDALVREAGYENIHAKYPFSVLGHRVPQVYGGGSGLGFLHFGWQSYWAFLSRGLFSQLLNATHEGAMDGLWAVEPHLGWAGAGGKFEEILVVENGAARWLGVNPMFEGREGKCFKENASS